MATFTRQNRLMSEIDLVKAQMAVFTTIILMAVDVINPVKIFMHVFPSILPWHIVTACVISMVYIFFTEIKELLYFYTKVFFHSILSIFFRDVEIIGLHNIPRFGPVIFTINHANQFIDAVTVVCTNERKISYLMAEKSWKRRIIGDLAWALDVVPVKRAQDDAVKGTGLITIHRNAIKTKPTNEDVAMAITQQDSTDDSMDKDDKPTFTVRGTSTQFKQELKPGDKIRPPQTAIALKIIQIQDDTELTCDATDVPQDFGPFDVNPVSFDVLKRVDQKVVYGKVLEKLADGGAIGIFPEGGSHDRTELLPLKVGVALIAYMAYERDGINVPIVPVGLNYFQAHKWRGRAVVEYGRPIMINPTTLKQYRAGGTLRRQVCNELLDRVEDSMKSVIVSTPDYQALQVIHTARRLYQRHGSLETSEKQDLNRRFAEGFKRLLTLTEGNPPKEWLGLHERIIAYGKELKELGLRDYQVPSLAHHAKQRTVEQQIKDGDVGDTVLEGLHVPYQIIHVLFLLVVSSIPLLFFNLPLGILATIYAERRRKYALSKSKVKIRGYDVMLTEKVVFCIVMVPTLWLTYAISLIKFSTFDLQTLLLIINTMPLFAYIGVICTEAGIVGWKDLRPLFLRLFPSSRRRLAKLPMVRKELQTDLRRFIKHLGPALGEIYYGRELDWQKIQEKTRRLPNTIPGTPTIEKPLFSISAKSSPNDDEKDTTKKEKPNFPVLTSENLDNIVTEAGASTLEMRRGDSNSNLIPLKDVLNYGHSNSGGENEEPKKIQ